MLDQRRAEEKGYITLKQAAKLTNYSPDYIGQLIRSGKIKGEQVYATVAWVTTEAEVRAYIADKTRTVSETDSVVTIPAYGERVFSYVLYSVIACLLLGLLFLQYIFYVNIDSVFSKSATAVASIMAEDRS